MSVPSFTCVIWQPPLTQTTRTVITHNQSSEMIWNAELHSFQSTQTFLLSTLTPPSFTSCEGVQCLQVCCIPQFFSFPFTTPRGENKVRLQYCANVLGEKASGFIQLRSHNLQTEDLYPGCTETKSINLDKWTEIEDVF